MNEIDPLISRQKWFDITGAKSKTGVCDVLRDNGITFLLRSDGWPSLTWEAYNHQLCRRIEEPSSNNNFNLSQA